MWVKLFSVLYEVIIWRRNTMCGGNSLFLQPYCQQIILKTDKLYLINVIVTILLYIAFTKFTKLMHKKSPGIKLACTYTSTTLLVKHKQQRNIWMNIRQLQTKTKTPKLPQSLIDTKRKSKFPTYAKFENMTVLLLQVTEGIISMISSWVM